MTAVAHIDAQFWTHPKARKCSLEAKALWLCGLLYGVQNRVDEVPESVINEQHPDAVIYAAELVDAGLWSYADSGWRIHDYHQWYPAADRRADLADAVRRGAGIDQADWSGDYSRQITDAHLRSTITPDEVASITNWLIGNWRDQRNPVTGLPKFATILAQRSQWQLSKTKPRSKSEIFRELAMANEHQSDSGHIVPTLHSLAANGD